MNFNATSSNKTMFSLFVDVINNQSKLNKSKDWIRLGNDCGGFSKKGRTWCSMALLTMLKIILLLSCWLFENITLRYCWRISLLLMSPKPNLFNWVQWVIPFDDIQIQIFYELTLKVKFLVRNSITKRWQYWHLLFYFASWNIVAH